MGKNGYKHKVQSCNFPKIEIYMIENIGIMYNQKFYLSLSMSGINNLCFDPLLVNIE